MKSPVYNVPGSKTGRFCSEHKEEGMVNVKSMKCEHPGCMKEPCFNVPGSKTGILCSEHKEEGMVNLKHIGR